MSQQLNINTTAKFSSYLNLVNIDKLVCACAKAWLFEGRNSILTPFHIRKYYDDIIIPDLRIIYKLRLIKKIKDKIKNAELDVDDDLGIWTSDFCKGLKDSGLFSGIHFSFYFYIEQHKEFLEDLKECRLAYKLSPIYKYKYCYIRDAMFLEYGSNTPIKDEKRYLAGLFTGCKIKEINGKVWLYIRIPKNKNTYLIEQKIINILNKWGIIYQKYKNALLVSPFYGSLFYGYMPIHSASRMLKIKNAALCPELPLLYWNICVRNKGESVAPPRKDILPFAASYAVYWYKKKYIKKEMRRFAANMGIVKIYPELQTLLQEWRFYCGGVKS